MLVLYDREGREGVLRKPDVLGHVVGLAPRVHIKCTLVELLTQLHLGQFLVPELPVVQGHKLQLYQQLLLTLLAVPIVETKYIFLVLD